MLATVTLAVLRHGLERGMREGVSGRGTCCFGDMMQKRGEDASTSMVAVSGR